MSKDGLESYVCSISADSSLLSVVFSMMVSTYFMNIPKKETARSNWNGP